MALKCDAVFEGGGVKGIGLVGAYSAIQKAGYELENLAGTSAGAIIASLIAAGYTANAIEQELENLNYNLFKDVNFLDKLGPAGKFVSILRNYGIYKGNFFKHWLEGLLRAKGVAVFGDIRTHHADDKFKYKFQAIVSDITEHRMMVIPGDLESYGYDTDKFNIAEAVRMSMSIPVFFEPYRLIDSKGKTHLIVDGGVLSNYPIWLLDDGTSDPEWPTFGFKLTDSKPAVIEADPTNTIHGIVGYAKSLVSTMIEGHDNYYVSDSRGDSARTIFISTTVTVNGKQKKINTTDFGITPEESKALFNNGVSAGETFLKSWNFEQWKRKYRESHKAVNQ